MKLPPWIANRFTITFGSMAVVIFAWNAYVAANNSGELSGVVRDMNGRPVGGAEIILERQNVTLVEEIARTQSDAEGRFSFDDHGEYSLLLSATLEDAKTKRERVKLLFRNQKAVAPDLVLRGAAD